MKAFDSSGDLLSMVSGWAGKEPLLPPLSFTSMSSYGRDYFRSIGYGVRYKGYVVDAVGHDEHAEAVGELLPRQPQELCEPLQPLPKVLREELRVRALRPST